MAKGRVPDRHGGRAVGGRVDGGPGLSRRDFMSRNAVFLTGTGISDDHFGENWLGDRNNWFSSAWAASIMQRAPLGALAAGRSWCGSLSGFAAAWTCWWTDRA